MSAIVDILAALPLVVGAGVAGWSLLSTDWHRVRDILAGRGGASDRIPPADDRWRRVHLDADRRAPFGGTSRRH